jgi:hypothetical protein
MTQLHHPAPVTLVKLVVPPPHIPDTLHSGEGRKPCGLTGCLDGGSFTRDRRSWAERGSGEQEVAQYAATATSAWLKSSPMTSSGSPSAWASA